MNKIFLIMLTIPVLAACSMTPKPTLDETLAGKNKTEQHAILQQECVKMAQDKRPSYIRHHYYISAEQRQRNLDVCNKMAEEMK